MTRVTASLLSLPLLAALAMLACSSEPPAPTPAPEQVAAPSETSSEAKGEANAEAGQAQGTPKIACDEPVYDFGAIKPTGNIQHVFKIRNVGDGELKIDRVQKT